MASPPVLWTIDGKEYEFPILTPADRIALGERFYEQDRERLVRDMRDAELPPDQRFAQLNELAAQRGMSFVVIRRLFTIAGAHAALNIALDRMADKPDLQSLADDHAVSIALKLVNFDIDPDELEKKISGERQGDDDDVDPTQAASAKTGTAQPQ